MKEVLRINDKELKYLVKRSARAKNLRITIYSDKNIVAILPKEFSLGFLKKFIIKKANLIFKKIDFLKNNSRKISETKKDYFIKKRKAEKIIKERIEYYNKFYNFSYNRISIKNQKTRWGSCSEKGNLNFNYKVAFLSQEQMDYIIVHELCHLKELNHSKSFWSLVSKTIKDYKNIRKQLKYII